MLRRGDFIVFAEAWDPYPQYVPAGTRGVVLRDKTNEIWEGDLRIALLSDERGDFDEWDGCVHLDAGHPALPDLYAVIRREKEIPC